MSRSIKIPIDVPGRPEVKRLPLPRAPFQSLVEELRSLMPYGAAPKINNSLKNSRHWRKDILLLRMWSLTTHEIFWPGICIPNLIMRKQPTNSNWGTFCKITGPPPKKKTGPHSSNISVLQKIRQKEGIILYKRKLKRHNKQYVILATGAGGGALYEGHHWNKESIWNMDCTLVKSYVINVTCPRCDNVLRSCEIIFWVAVNTPWSTGGKGIWRKQLTPNGPKTRISRSA